MTNFTKTVLACISMLLIGYLLAEGIVAALFHKSLLWIVGALIGDLLVVGSVCIVLYVIICDYFGQDTFWND